MKNQDILENTAGLATGKEAGAEPANGAGDKESKLRLALFASGRGSNVAAILKAHKEGKLAGLTPVLLFTDKDCPALDHARNYPLACKTLYPGDFATREAHEEAILDLLRQYEVDIIALAGYMRLLGRPLLDAFGGRILNIHPSLLPEFPGTKSIERAYTRGVPFTGVTVHLVDEGMDTGPILRQERVDIPEGMTLAELETAIHQVEHQLYPSVLAAFAKNLREKL